MSDVVEKQIKEMLTRYRAEIRKASDEAKNSGQDMANGLKAADTQIKALLTTTQKLNTDGSITETIAKAEGLNSKLIDMLGTLQREQANPVKAGGLQLAKKADA